MGDGGVSLGKWRLACTGCYQKVTTSGLTPLKYREGRVRGAESCAEQGGSSCEVSRGRPGFLWLEALGGCLRPTGDNLAYLEASDQFAVTGRQA